MAKNNTKQTGKLFSERRRFVYHVPSDAYIEGHGYRPSVVFEHESGHFPVGDWPYEGKPGQTAPWFWGHDHDKAVEMADEMNERLGISAREAAEIVASSMRVSGEIRHGKS
jgi:hypothetical protein